ncbi:hypothetical protein C8R45DRAFT_1041221 [Mycena sanguinolenta]|nr:hypothetical protein C8R45DRAFT_1041221 [Mycena sanguinolenta]
MLSLLCHIPAFNYSAVSSLVSFAILPSAFCTMYSTVMKFHYIAFGGFAVLTLDLLRSVPASLQGQNYGTIQPWFIFRHSTQVL